MPAGCGKGPIDCMIEPVGQGDVQGDVHDGSVDVLTLLGCGTWVGLELGTSATCWGMKLVRFGTCFECCGGVVFLVGRLAFSMCSFELVLPGRFGFSCTAEV